MTAAEMEILVKILAQTDAAWLPVRGCLSHRWPNVYSARRDFQAGRGTSWTAGGSQADSRTLAGLVSSGLVVRHRKLKSSKTMAVSLSPAGYWTARHLCRWISPGSSLEFVRAIGLQLGRGEKWCGDEREITRITDQMPIEDAKAELKFLEDALLPALVAGWCESLANTQRLISYWVTPSGLAALKTGVVAPDGLPVMEKAEVERFRDLYDDHMNTTLLAMDEPTAGVLDIGAIPLGAGGPGIVPSAAKRAKARRNRLVPENSSSSSPSNRQPK